MKNKIIFGMVVLLAVLLSTVTYAASTNVSILYGWNGTSFVPVQVTSDGSLKTNLNLTESSGISPQVNNTYDLGTAALLWANLYARSIRGGSGPLSLFAGNTELITMLANGNVGIATTNPTSRLHVTGDTNVTGTFYAAGIVANLENATGFVNISLNYGYNGSTFVPLLTTPEGLLRLTVDQASADNATSLMAGATGSDLTLTGTLTVQGVNVTGRQIADNTTTSNRIGTQETKQTADNSTLLALLGQKLNLTGGTLSGSLSGTVGTFANGLNVTAGGLIITAGNVGIGTTGPGEKLSVAGVAKIDSIQVTGSTAPSAGLGTEIIYTGSAGRIQAFNRTGGVALPMEVSGSTTALQIQGVTKLQIDSSGNVGIGTPPSAWNLGKAVELGVVGNALWNSGSASDMRVLANLYYSSAFKFAGTGYASYYQQYAGVHSWAVSSASGTAGNTATMNEAMRIDTTGNVGIGHNNPGTKLSVSSMTDSPDTVPALGSFGGRFSIVNANAYGIVMGVLGTGNVFQQVQRVDGTATAYNLLLQPNGGNVGIGTTAPTKALEVGRNEAGAVTGIKITAGSTVAAPVLDFNYADAAADSKLSTIFGDINGGFNFGTKTDAGTPTTRLFIKRDGNVGIGTTSPGAPLHVAKTVDGDNAVVYVDNLKTSPTGNTGAAIAFQTVGVTKSQITSNFGDNNLYIFHGGANRLIIASDGTFTGSATNDISDVRLKENVTTVTGALDKLAQLRGVRFTWKEEAQMTDRPQFGVLAQEVETVFPELVLNGSIRGGDYKSVQYGGFVAPFIEAIKELDVRTRGLETTGQGDLTISGNVGIGTTSPNYKLDVNGTINLPADTWISGAGRTLVRDSFFGYSSGYRVTQLGADLSTRDIAIGVDPTTVAGGAFTGTGEIALPNSVEFMQKNSGGTDWIQNVLVLNNGNVGIGTTGPTGKLHVVGGTDSTTWSLKIYQSAGSDLLRIRDDGVLFTGNAASSPYNSTTGSAANMFVASDGSVQRSTSSLKFKADLEPLNITHVKSVLSALATGPAAGFTYRGIGTADDRHTRFIGWGAETVAPIEPLLVARDKDGNPNSIMYDRAAVYLTAGWLDHEQRIAAQQDKINQLEARLAAVESKIK